jgi:hypothetical protein
MTASPERGSKVFELLEGGAAARKAGRRKLNVFARWAIQDVDMRPADLRSGSLSMISSF